MQRRFSLTRHRDERGSVIVFVAITLVVLIGFAALAVDLGNTRQQRREAQVAADAGALAGAYTLTTTSIAACGYDAQCNAAYYTFQSLGVHVGTSPTWTTGGCGTSCISYTIGGQIVQVTHPYPFGGSDGSMDVRVQVCWSKPNAFATIFGIGHTTVCGRATGERIGGAAVGGNTGYGGTPLDCSGIDDFADATDKPQIIPTTGTTIKAGVTIGAKFAGQGVDLDPSSIVFRAPAFNGTEVTLGYDPTATQGYKLMPAPPLDANGNPLPYVTGHGVNVTITYKIPNAPPLPKLDNTGARIVYKASLYAAPVTQTSAAPKIDCGNAQWQFTWDGQALSTGSCGENSFVGSVYPTAGTAAPGDHIGAIYTDESPLQSQPYSAAFKFGVKFTLTGPGWTDADGNPTYLTYQLLPASGQMQYNTKIDFQLPDATHFVPGLPYTAELTAYDTDQNKPGNDCGHAVWTFTVPSGTAADVHLVE